MWVFITSRLRTWIIFAIAVPVATLIVRKIRQSIEARSGQTRVVKTLTRLEQLGQRRRRSKRD